MLKELLLIQEFNFERAATWFNIFEKSVFYNVMNLSNCCVKISNVYNNDSLLYLSIMIIQLLWECEVHLSSTFPIDYHEPVDVFSLKLHAANKNPAAKWKWISKYGLRAMVSNRGCVFRAKITWRSSVCDRCRTNSLPPARISCLFCSPLFFSYVCIGPFLQ